MFTPAHARPPPAGNAKIARSVDPGAAASRWTATSGRPSRTFSSIVLSKR